MSFVFESSSLITSFVGENVSSLFPDKVLDRAQKIVHVIFIFKNFVNEENLVESQKKNSPLVNCQVRRSYDQSKAGSQLDDFYRHRNIFDKSAEDKF